MAFRVGQKVVCIIDHNDRPPTDSRMLPGFWLPFWPSRGQIYTVRSVECDEAGTWLRFAELLNPTRQFKDRTTEASFISDRFRPLVERKTDISIFTEMLKPKQLERVR